MSMVLAVTPSSNAAVAPALLSPIVASAPTTATPAAAENTLLFAFRNTDTLPFLSATAQDS